jgi:hypothetical protein
MYNNRINLIQNNMTTAIKSKPAKTTQSFIRLNIDDKMQKYLDYMQKQYPFLSNTDIVRMIISQSASSNYFSFNSIFGKLDTIDGLTEDEQNNILIKNQMM